MFAGVMTPAGFVDFFDHIMPLENARRRYYLKGASGSGKSTFIKKIAAGLASSNFNIDFFHCANDAASLDGMAVKELGFSIIDATMPHSHDPELPAAIDVIIDFAQFLDGAKVTKHISEIMRLTTLKKRHFGQAQKFLSMIGGVLAEEKIATATPTEKDLAREYVNSFTKNDTLIGYNRKMFLSAVTSDGVKNFNNILDAYKIHKIDGNSAAFLEEVKSYANVSGVNTESFYCPLQPTNILHLVIPQEGIVFTNVCNQIGYLDNATATHEIIKSLLNSAISEMKAARSFHEKIEKIYISAMNFAGINNIADKILDECRHNILPSCPSL